VTHKLKVVIIILLLGVSVSLLGCGKAKEPNVAKGRTGKKIATLPAPTPAAVPIVQTGVAAVNLPSGTTPQAVAKPETPKYIYKSSGRRDPFVPLVGKSESRSTSATGGEISPASTGGLNVNTLSLEGLIWDKTRPYVLLKSPDGTTYIVADNKLVDDRGRVIKGIAAVVQKDKITLIGKDKVLKEFKFSKIREESD
jgi:hypothetical protein